jgi:ArsR family transcriptional regulator
MGITKNHIHTREQIELANLFKALAHPARIAIVENLLTYETLNCTELRFYIPLAQSTLSEHLRILQDVGILAVRVEGNKAYFFVQKLALQQIIKYTSHLTAKIDLKSLNFQTLFLKRFPYLISKNVT